MAESTAGSLKSKAIRSIKWNALSAGSSVGVQVLRTLILARILEPRDYGLMGMMMVAMGFADAFCDAGLSGAIIHRQTEDRKVLSSLFWMNLMMGVGVYALLAASVPALVWYYREPVIVNMSLVLFLSVIFRSLGRQFEAILAKDLKFKQIAVIEIVSGTISLLIAIFCALRGLGVWSLVWSQLSKVAIQGLVQLALNWNAHRPTMHFCWADVRPFLGFSLFQLGEMNIRYFAQRFDQMILARLLGAGALGYYNFAYQLILLPTQRVNPIVTRVAFPVFAKLQNETSRLRNLYVRVIHLLSVVNAPLLVFIGIFAPLYLPLLFGAKWNASIPLIQLFAIVAYARSIGNPMGSLLLAKGRADIGFYMNVALMILNIPFVFVGVKLFGALGAIAGLLVVQLMLNIPLYFSVIRKLIGPCGTQFSAAWAGPVWRALVSGGMGWAFAHWMLAGFHPWLCLVSGGGLFALLYAGLTLWFEPDLLQQVKLLRAENPEGRMA